MHLQFFSDVHVAVPCSSVAVFLIFWVEENWYRLFIAFMAVYFLFWRWRKYLTATPDPVFAQTCLRFYVVNVVFDVDVAVHCILFAVYSIFWPVYNLYSIILAFTDVFFGFCQWWKPYQVPWGSYLANMLAVLCLDIFLGRFHFAVPCFCVAVFSFFWTVDNLYRFCFAFAALYFFFWRWWNT